MEIQTKFSIGDVVYFARTVGVQKKHPCPDCLGSKKWSAKSPAGSEFTFTCPRCSSSYQSDRDLSLAYHEFEGTASRLTIGSVRTDTAVYIGDDAVSYMCLETGVGSGSVYREGLLFSDKSEAIAKAIQMAAEQNSTTPWVAELYAKTLSLSDYQMESAKLEAATTARIRLGIDVENLFDDLRTCEDIDEVKVRLEEGFKPRESESAS